MLFFANNNCFIPFWGIILVPPCPILVHHTEWIQNSNIVVLQNLVTLLPPCSISTPSLHFCPSMTIYMGATTLHRICLVWPACALEIFSNDFWVALQQCMLVVMLATKYLKGEWPHCQNWLHSPLWKKTGWYSSNLVPRVIELYLGQICLLGYIF